MIVILNYWGVEMTRRQKKQGNKGVSDCIRGVEHKDGRGKFYDLAYSQTYALLENSYHGLAV